MVEVSKALNRLPADQRDAVIRHHMMGAPMSEIAEQMGWTKKAVAGSCIAG